jgi:hypothetical protein
MVVAIRMGPLTPRRIIPDRAIAGRTDTPPMVLGDPMTAATAIAVHVVAVIAAAITTRTAGAVLAAAK